MEDEIVAMLERYGIAVRKEDIPFLQRAFLRQQELMRGECAQLPPGTEPAHVFKVSG